VAERKAAKNFAGKHRSHIGYRVVCRFLVRHRTVWEPDLSAKRPLKSPKASRASSAPTGYLVLFKLHALK